MKISSFNNKSKLFIAIYLSTMFIYQNVEAQNSEIQSFEDTAMVISISGDVKFSENCAKLSSLIKVNKGKEILVDENAVVELIYLFSNFREIWHGPAIFKIGEIKSEQIEGKPYLTEKIKGFNNIKRNNFNHSSRHGMVRLVGNGHNEMANQIKRNKKIHLRIKKFKFSKKNI